MRARLPILAAGLLVLAAAAPASAATVSESVTIPATLTVTGVPASIDYGTVTPGTTSAFVTISPVVSSNGSVQMALTATNFTAGAKTLSAATRRVRIPAASLDQFDTPPGMDTDRGYNVVIADNPIATATAPNLGTFDLELAVSPSGDQAPGTYSGSVELAFTAS